MIVSMLCAVLCGCSDKNGAVSEDVLPQIELIEPVGTALSYERAAYRDIAAVSTYTGIVCPDSTEYTYESDYPFAGYGALPGESVKKGEPLFYSQAPNVDDDVLKIEEENAALMEDYADYLEDYVYDLSQAKKAEYKASVSYQDVKNYEPEDEDSAMYAAWAKGAMPLENQYKQAVMSREKLEEAYIERQELFELDYAYNEKRICRLKEKVNEGRVNCATDGVVVAVSYANTGERINRGTGFMAVGNPDDKEIKCEFVSKSVVGKALEVYAIIDGKRYEVAYENMEPEEYRRLLKKNDAVYTTFKISDPENEIPLGKMAVVVVVEKKVTNSLCVPKDAVSKDDSGFYVYVVDGQETVYTPVQTGMTDGCYTQITYGLRDGDKILYDAPYDLGTKFDTVKKGSVEGSFSSDGYLFYPFAEWMSNPAKTGTCYIKEIFVDRFEQVSEGQVLASVEVTGDNVETDRITRKIQRQQERLVDLYELKGKTNDEDELVSIERAIRERERSTERLQEQLDKQTKYLGVIEIKAPYDGIVTDVSTLKPGELIGYDTNLVQLSSNDSSYIVVEDKGFLSYGNEVTVTYKDQSGTRTDATGMVVSLNPYGLSKDLSLGYTLIRLSKEDMDRFASAGSDLANGYWSRSRYSVSAVAKDMHDVLLVPKSAVYKTGNDTYVITKDENNEAKLVKFYAGGADNLNYWVAYGQISEGMEICLE